jgi:outer membrane biosynthesis protein TonB
MRGFQTKYEKQSAAITTLIGAIILLLLIFVLGLSYLDPVPEYGMEVNFGTSKVGSGNIQPNAKLKPAAVQNVQEKVEEVKVTSPPKPPQEEVAEETPKESATENVITQDTEEAIAIKKEEVRRKAEMAAEEKAKAVAAQKARAEKERLEKIEQEKQAAIAKAQAEQDEKKRKLDALMGGVSNSDGTETGGEGNDAEAGDKGQENGDPIAKGYYGNSGAGSGGNYQLGDRAPLSKPKPDYLCNEEGKVVVSIAVNQSGKVISAQAGVRGTTNNAQCLLEQAKIAAMKTRWEGDSSAPEKQLGKIIYNFKLTE